MEPFKKLLYNKYVRIIAAVTGALIIGWWISSSSLGRKVELQAMDIQFKLARNSKQPDSSIVIVTIDQNSIQYFKQNGHISTPWPRDFYAITTKYFHKAGAKAIVFDFLFNEPDEDRVASPGAVNDSLFADAIQKAGNVYLSMQLTTKEENDQPGDTLIDVREENMSHGESLYVYDKTYAPLISFQRKAHGIGVVNFIPDEDGICRRIPLFYRYQQRSAEALSYIVYRDLVGVKNASSIQSPHLVYWYGKGGPYGVFKYYSIHAVIISAIKLEYGKKPDIPLDQFKDKIILIGSNAPGLLDLRPTPFTSEEPYPGVEIHATVLSNFLQHHFITESSALSNIIIALLLTFVAALVTTYAGNILVSTMSVLAMGLLYCWGASKIFMNEMTSIKIVFPVASLMFGYIISVGWSFATEGRSKRQIQKIFGEFVNPHVVQLLSANPDVVNLVGEEVEATILFTDIEGFTTIAEGREPKALVAFLNEYFSMATDICFRYYGTIDKFLGDAIMVQFGIPLKNANHALLAVRAAYEFSHALNDKNVKAGKAHTPVFSTRIGINSGLMVAGYIGGRSKKEYTVIGDTVNLASRLEGVNKIYGTSVILSEFTARQVQDEFALREMDLIRVKGKVRPVKIYELLGKRSEQTEMMDQIGGYFESALQLYRRRQWRKAISAFQKVLKLRPDEPSKRYIKRCIEYSKNPPPKNWDGVWVMLSK